MSSTDPARAKDNDSDEEDYMSMIIEEPQEKETFSQKKRRQQREAEARARVPSKAERAAEEAARRDAALATSTLDPSNKGFQMMAKLGFKPGQALGKQPTPQPTTGEEAGEKQGVEREAQKLAVPLDLMVKEDRGGIGLDSEKKRKFREEAAEVVKKVKQEEGDYRDRVRLEREMRRAEAQFHAAQKVAERLDGEAEAEGGGEGSVPALGSADDGAEDGDGKKDETSQDETDAKPKPKAQAKPTAQINVLYRGLVREREERERAAHARHILQTSLPSSFFPSSRLPGYDDPTLEPDDHEALGSTKPDLSRILEEETEEEDPELDEFNALEPSEKLARVVQYLREKHRYCFWCKYTYETDEMEGCPGLTEEEHD
ncbi:hypothetical protein P168DRAFT_303563 [Aspergillus campestris IBT 28561]|uniref:G-patch domain-containing protein n=1 Tax=Aspergillus campestris (strain IBT 28561) TaxID=1392248 RepID=A0A2I1D7M4_ASPC2|nr:uncharacterized protein P168DRAFT_303563 [Aspergillus campestris IBT 28561]PKY05858.1 hypothetical protein P168DRAFT_303563 [Aspergillus campestris IBT 28561]